MRTTLSQFFKRSLKNLKEQYELDFMFEQDKDVPNFYLWSVVRILKKWRCKIAGHKLSCETGGDGESGPITYYHCKRGCGTNFNTHFGM